MPLFLIANFVCGLPMEHAISQANRPLAECRKLQSTAEKADV